MLGNEVLLHLACNKPLCTQPLPPGRSTRRSHARRPHPLTVLPDPEAAGKWPEDTSNPPVHGQHTGTRGMVHPSLCRVAQHQPN